MRQCSCKEHVVYAKRDRHIFVVCGGERVAAVRAPGICLNI